MLDEISLSVSILALVLSILTAWLTFFRRGTVKMTRPTVICFLHDQASPERSFPKIFIRTLLFSTAQRGRVVESMYVTISRNETRQSFNIWIYGEPQLVRGSGLFVGENGVVANHHFLMPEDGSTFHFSAGEYRLEVFSQIHGERKQRLLFSDKLQITSEAANQLKDERVALYFDWSPTTSQYLPHIDKKSIPSPK